MVGPSPASAAGSEHVDVLVVGAGLPGIGAACHLRRECPGTTFAILESRGAIGGTWDLFRYPGVRSDRLLTMPPEKAAAQILTAVERRRPRVLVGWSAKVPDALVRLLPGSYWRLVGRSGGRGTGSAARD